MGGTDNHLILWDLRPHGLTGAKVEKLCDICNITLNKNCVAGDASALSPGGVRIGTPAMTTRGCKQDDMVKIAGFLDRAVQIALQVQEKVGKKLKDFEAALPANPDVLALKQEVNECAIPPHLVASTQSRSVILDVAYLPFQVFRHPLC